MFYNDKPAMLRSRANHFLDQKVNYRGMIMSRRRFLMMLSRHNTIAERLDLRTHRGNTRAYYFAHGWSITKIEVDYLEYLNRGI